MDELPQDALLLPPAPSPGLRPGTRHQVQSPKIPLIKGTVPRDFRLLVFFMNQFPQAPEYNIKAISIFSKILGDICGSRCTTGVVDTVANGKNLQSENF